MPKTKLDKQSLFQIRVTDPEIIHKFKIYAVTNNMTQGEAFTKAVQLLLERS